MGREQFSTTRNADDPVYRCEEQGLKDIYPVRFGFSPVHLQQFSFQDNPTLGRRRELDSLDFEVRKLRQGYIYLYIKNRIYPEKHRTDPETSNWMVFWYKTNIADENSAFLKTSAHDFMGAFREQTFTRLLWPNNDPAEKWVLAEKATFDTIKIPDYLNTVEIAYSEEPWPADFFKKCENDASFRSQLMMPFDLAPELTETSCAISLMDNYVEEFKPDANSKVPDYQVAHTGFNPTSKRKLGLTQSEKFEGRVVALPDAVGELLELERQAINVNATLMQHNADYLYPLTTAECIDSVNAAIFSTRNKLQAKTPFFEMPTQHEDIRLNLLSENDELSTNLRRLVKNHTVLLQLDEPYEALTQLRLMLEGLTKVDTESALRRLVLASRLFVRFFMNINDTSEGSQELMTLLNPNQGHTVSRLFRNLMLTWTGVSAALLDKNLEALNAFDVVLEVTAKELGVLGTAKIKSLGVSEAIEKLHPIQNLGRHPISASDLSELIKTGDLPALTSGGKVITDYKKFSQSKVFAGDVEITPTIPSKDTVDVQHFIVDGQIRPGAHFKQIADSQRPQRGYGVGLSLLINAWTFFDLASQKEEVGYDKTWFGRVSNDTHLNIGLGFVAIVSELEKFTQFKLNYVDDLSANTLRKGGATDLFSNIKGKLFSPKSINAISTGKTGIAQQVTPKIKTAGKIAGWAGVVLAAFAAYEANANKQEIKRNLLITQALAGGIMLLNLSASVNILAGFVLGIAMAAEFLFTRDKMTAWAEHGFWGRSEEYWGSKRPKRFQDQLDIAVGLSEENSELKHFYQNETHDFQRLVYNMAIKNRSTRNCKFDVLLPRLSQGDFELKVHVGIYFRYYKDELNPAWYRHPLYRRLSGFRIDTDLARNMAHINFRKELFEAMPEQPGYIQRIKVVIKYTDPTGHEAPLIIENFYHDDREEATSLAERWSYRIPKQIKT